MYNVEFTDELKSYELNYWIAHKNEKNIRSSIMKKLFNGEIIQADIAVDVGSGPYCGIFNELLFKKMYAVDPLWFKYKTLGIAKMINNVKCIESTAEEFNLSEKADVIFSFNALDHSGLLLNSFHNIMSNLNVSGRFYFHIHLRTKDQLNTGHRMVVTEKIIDNILNPYNILDKKIVDMCPLDNKNYRSYIAIVGKKEI